MNYSYDPDGPTRDGNGRWSDALDRAHDIFPQLCEWRRRFHTRPELSFKEYETAAYIIQVLESIPGMTVTRNVGGTQGVIGHVGNFGGKHIALRADMDALAIEEPFHHEFCSATPGIMHACGHDGHMAILLGAAQLIAEDVMQNHIHAEVSFIFQPAEETADDTQRTGAPYLVDAGALNGVDAVLALHMDPTTPVGLVRMHDGVCMANVDNFRARIEGKGGHAGYPNLALDPLWLLLPVLEAIHGIRSRRLSPLDQAAVSVCKIQGGTTNNVIPSFVDLEGTLRSYTDDSRDLIIKELQRSLEVAETLGGWFELQVQRGEPAVVNNAGLNRILRQAVLEVTRMEPLWTGPFGMGGEDFGFMSQRIPGSLFFLGCAASPDKMTSLHAPDFFLDERALPLGVAVWLEAVKRMVQTDAGQ
ncbi:MAG: amidohydrolase [Sulfobacillus benefaciens]|uniref:Amidohydrolase n=1 Tax=Sulfobacillus benefaciens TaxID=453960 RepID=A0A2T2X6R8_9FIRM|nr:MAG: amidohydrolase [Sulfobacillus benefaciens]